MRELPLPTDTALVRIESRQYKLFDVDLGDGIPRSTLIVAACAFAPWLLLCYLIGVDLPDLLLVWLLPPAAVTWAAMSRDDSGRSRLVAWTDLAMWYVRRPQPIVNAGTTPPAAPRPISVPVAFLVLDEPTTAQETTRA